MAGKQERLLVKYMGPTRARSRASGNGWTA